MGWRMPSFWLCVRLGGTNPSYLRLPSPGWGQGWGHAKSLVSYLNDCSLSAKLFKCSHLGCITKEAHVFGKLIFSSR